MSYNVAPWRNKRVDLHLQNKYRIIISIWNSHPCLNFFILVKFCKQVSKRKSVSSSRIEHSTEAQRVCFNSKSNQVNAKQLVIIIILREVQNLSGTAVTVTAIVPRSKKTPCKFLFLEKYILNNLNLSLLITYTKCNTV